MAFGTLPVMRVMRSSLIMLYHMAIAHSALDLRWLTSAGEPRVSQ